MHTYEVTVTAHIPYPWSATYRREASNAAAATSRALKDYRKEERVRGKRISTYEIKVHQLT